MQYLKPDFEILNSIPKIKKRFRISVYDVRRMNPRDPYWKALFDSGYKLKDVRVRLCSIDYGQEMDNIKPVESLRYMLELKVSSAPRHYFDLAGAYRTNSINVSWAQGFVTYIKYPDLPVDVLETLMQRVLTCRAWNGLRKKGKSPGQVVIDELDYWDYDELKKVIVTKKVIPMRIHQLILYPQ